MKRVWWALPTTVLVCTGLLSSGNAADLRVKRKPNPGPFRSSESKQPVKTVDATSDRSAKRGPAVVGNSTDENLQTEPDAAGRTRLTPADPSRASLPLRSPTKAEETSDDSLIERLLSHEGLTEPKSRIQTVSAEVPADEAPADSQRYGRQRTKSHTRPSIDAATDQEQSDAPDASEEAFEPVPKPAQRRITSELRQKARKFLKSETAPIGAAPSRSKSVPIHEEVPAPGVDDHELPAAGTKVSTKINPADYSASPEGTNDIQLTESLHQPSQRATPRNLAHPSKISEEASAISTYDDVSEETEVPTPVPAPAPLTRAPLRNSAATGSRTTSPAPQREIQAVEHRTRNPSLSEAGELPALQPGATAGDESDVTPPPPPTRSRPTRKLTRRVQQTSISSAAAVPSPRLVQATAQSPQTPSINLRWVTNGEVAVGQPCKCGLVVKNSSNSDAHNILVEATFPKTVRIVSTKPQAQVGQESMIWNFADFPAGEERTIEVTMIPHKKGELATSASVRFTGTASTVMKVEEPDLAVIIKGQQEAMIGETVSHTVSVSNPGTGVAQDVTIHAVIPKGLEHSRGKRIEMTVGTLAAGETREVRLALAAVAGGDHTLHVEARSGQHLIRRADSVIHVAAPKVNVTVQGPVLRYVGRQAQYMVTVSNVGSIATDNVRVQMQVAPGFDFVKADNGGRNDWNSRAVTWFLGRLEANQTAEFPVTLTARQSGTHQHTVTVTDEVGGTSTGSVETRVEATSAIVMEVADLDDPVEVGTQTAYEIRIRNDGTKAAQDLVLNFEIPPGVELLDTQGPTTARRGKGGVTFKALPLLNPKQRATYRVIVTGREAGNLRFRAKLTSNASTEPLLVEEQTKFYAD